MDERTGFLIVMIVLLACVLVEVYLQIRSRKKKEPAEYIGEQTDSDIIAGDDRNPPEGHFKTAGGQHVVVNHYQVADCTRCGKGQNCAGVGKPWVCAYCRKEFTPEVCKLVPLKFTLVEEPDENEPRS